MTVQVQHPVINRQWLLRRRPVGLLRAADLEYVESDASIPLRQGQIRIRNLLLLCAPTMRNWMEAKGHGLHPSMPIGRPVAALSAARIVETKSPKHAVGSYVLASSGWTDYDIIEASSPYLQSIPNGMTSAEAIGSFGLNSLTAYFGLLRVGLPKTGETLVVSGAAGSTGSVAAQIGKIIGCHVIGIAGGPTKCGWLLEKCGIDGVIDYQTENVEDRLRTLCPKGIDIFYDNVGGDILQAAVENMAKFGRIVLCGQIAGYNDNNPVPGPRNMMRLIYGSIRIQGFLMTDYAGEIANAREQLKLWVDQGKLIARHDIRSGFLQLPDIFNALFKGQNDGCLLADIAS